MRMRKKKWTEKFLSENSSLLINNKKKFDCLEIFNNDNDVYLEIGSGKGNFIITYSKNNTDKNFVAFEKDTTVVGVALKGYISNIDEENKNLRFLNSYAEKIADIFPKKSVNKIFLNFSDPWPKRGYEKRRLTSISFLEMYFEILKDNGNIEIKTDSDILYEYTIEEVKEHKKFNIDYMTKDLYNDNEMIKLNIQTEYEKRFVSQGIKIKKIVLSKNI